jgi:hypothetical protein
MPMDAFTFTRVAQPLIEGTGYHIVMPPSLLTQL